MFKFTNAVI